METQHTQRGEYRIFGPPGTGKTTFLSRQIVNAAESYGSSQVFVASFTKAAARELVGRNLPLDDRQIGTLHAHAYRTLGRPEVAESKVDDWNSVHPNYRLSHATKAEDEADEALGGTYDGDQLYSRLQVLRAQLVPEQAWPMSVAAFATAWQAWKDDCGYIDFTDMIDLALHNTETAPGDPRVGFFDEAQDFTPLELALVNKWGAHMDFFLKAGDEDQNLYRFKGALPEAFLLPVLSSERKRILGQSYRVPEAVRSLADAWIKRVQKREPKEYRPRRDDQGVIVTGEVLLKPGLALRNTDSLLREIETYRERGKSVMLLASCSYHLDPLKYALRDAGIPFANPYRRRRGDWNPLAPRKGVSTIARFLAYIAPREDLWPAGQHHWWHGHDIFLWSDLLKKRGIFTKEATEIIRHYRPEQEIPAEDLTRIFTPAVVGAVFDCDLDWLQEHAQAKYQKTLTYPRRVLEKGGARALIDEPQVIIGTIHSVKGGEADVVFLFPDLSKSGVEEWNGTIEGRDSIIRQFYVGMTRARETLILGSASGPYAIPSFQ